MNAWKALLWIIFLALTISLGSIFTVKILHNLQEIPASIELGGRATPWKD